MTHLHIIRLGDGYIRKQNFAQDELEQITSVIQSSPTRRHHPSDLTSSQDQHLAETDSIITNPIQPHHHSSTSTKNGNQLTSIKLQIGRKQRRIQLVLHIIEPRLLRRRADGIQTTEPQPDQSINGRLRREALADLLRRLHRLVLHHQPADRHVVQVHVTPRRRPVAVLDTPAGAAQQLGRARRVGTVDILPGYLGRGERAGEYPQVGGARVEVKVECLGGRADGHGRHVGYVVLVDGDGGC